MGVLSWGNVQVQTKGTANLNGVGPDFFLSLVVSVQLSGLGLGSEACLPRRRNGTADPELLISVRDRRGRVETIGSD